jgi:hypothetical protein
MSDDRDDVPAIREIAAALGRAGLHASAEVIADLVVPRRKSEQALEALKRQLDPRTEPALTFRASDAPSRVTNDAD